MTKTSGSPAVRDRFIAAVRNIATVDHRSLALFRIALTCVLLFDLNDRYQELLLHYSDLGLVSAHFAIAAKLQTLQPTYLFGIRWPSLLRGFFAFTALVYFAFGLGLRTRIFNVLALLCALSLHSRNFMIGHSGDAFSHALLAWSLFLPLSARWSIDAYLARHGRAGVPTDAATWRGQTRPEVTGLAVLGLKLEIVALFVLDGLAKTGPSWTDGSAWHYILWLDSIARPAALWLRSVAPQWTLQALSWLHPWIEIGGGLALLSPRAPLRRVALALLALGLLWLGTLVQQGSLVPLACVALTIFVSGEGFEQLAARVEGRRSVPSPHPVTPHSALEVFLSACRFSPRENPPPEHHIESSTRRIAELVAGAFLVAALLSMAARNPALPAFMKIEKEPAWTRIFNEPLALGHSWGSFAPDPPRTDGRFVLAGTTRSGRKVEVQHGGPVPQRIDEAMGGTRSMQDLAFDVRLRYGWLETMKPELARFCWNAHLLKASEHREPLVECRGLVLERASPPPGEKTRDTATQPTRVRLVFTAQHSEMIAVQDETEP